MKKLIPNILQALIVSGIIADHWFGYYGIGNLTFALLWCILILSLIALAIRSKVIFKNETKKTVFDKAFISIIVILLVYAGWWGTIMLWSVTSLSMRIKKLLWKNEVEKLKQYNSIDKESVKGKTK